MDRTTTQFFVAVLAVAGLVSLSLVAVGGAALGNGDKDLAFAAITGLTGITGPAVAFLFRLNNHERG